MSTHEFVVAGELVLGRAPTGWELNQILRVAGALDARPDDIAVKLLFLQFHLIQQQRMLMDQGSKKSIFDTFCLAYRKQLLTTAIGVILGSALLLAGSFQAGVQRGRDAEIARKVELVRLVEPEWLQMPGGPAAKTLFDAGLADSLANCAVSGWTKRDGWCVTGQVNGALTGFKMP